MKPDYVRLLPVGSTLRLKDERAKAFGMDTVHVTLEFIKERPGYTVPFLACKTIKGTLAYFKPSDFAKAV